MTSISTIEQWHNAILLREPDPVDVRFWLSELSAQKSDPGGLIASFLSSPEYAANVLPVMILYQVGLGRIPDIEGLRYWSSALSFGQSIDLLAESFAKSPEFGDLFGSVLTSSPSRNMITVLFQKTFGREPTAAEIAVWSSSGFSQAQLLASFVQSQEALERLIESSHIISAYLALEGQLPTQEQLQAAINLGDITQILNELLKEDVSQLETDSFADDVGGGDSSFIAPPTLTINYEPLISTNVTTQSSLRGVLLLNDQFISEIEAGIPIALHELPMLSMLTSAPLVAQSESGERSDPSPQIVTFGTTGDDIFNAEGESAIQYVFTGDGDDIINGGMSNDYLYGGDDSDTIWGDDGDDMIFGGPGADILDGGDGVDSLNYTDVHSTDTHGIEDIAGMAINLSSTPQVLDAFIDGLFSFNDTFIYSEWLNARIINLQSQRFGSSGDENPNILEENSVAYLLSAESEVSAPRDSVSNFEIVLGSPLDDFIFTQGDYEIDGAHGDDIIISQGNRLLLRGAQGNDFLFAVGESIELDGGSGDDILIWSPPFSFEYEMIPTARITGGAGADQILLGFGGGGQISIALYAEASDSLNLGGLSDSNYFEQDRILGLNWEDYFDLHLSNLREFSPDSIRFEMVDIDADSPVYLYSVNTNPLADGRVDSSIDSAGDIQVLITNSLMVESDSEELSSFWADHSILNLTGTDQDDSLMGGVNNDSISGGEGNDMLEGGGGMDVINLGNGSNAIIFNAFAHIEALEEETGDIGWSDSNTFAKDVVNGFDEDDFVVLNLYNLEDFLFEEDVTVNSIEDGFLYAVDTNYLASDLSSGIADLEIIIHNPADSLDAFDLKDRTILNLYGTDFSDNIRGGINGDTIVGGDGNDIIEGNPGDDFLHGDGGDDAIDGGSGADYLFGGSGSDTFRYQDNSTGITIDTADTIGDFIANDDLISIDIPEYLSTDASFRMEDGSTLSDFNQFVGRADQAFVDGMSIFVAFNVGFLSGDGLSAINNDGNSNFSDGDSLIVLLGVNTESSISGANFIAEVD